MSTTAKSTLSRITNQVKDGTFSEMINDWKWIFTYSRRYKSAILFYTVIGVISSCTSLLASVATKHVVDIIAGYEYHQMSVMAALMVGSSIFSLVFNNLVHRLSTKLSLRINNEIQADIFDKIIDIDWMALSQYPNGDILNRFNGDVYTVAENAVSWIPSIVIALFNLFATFFVIWHYNKIMAMLAFATAPILLVLSRYFIRKQREYGKKTREASSRLMSFETETIYNIDTLKAFGIMDLFSARLKEKQNDYKEVALKRNLFKIQTDIVMSIISLIVQYSAFAYCLWLLWTDQIKLGTMVLFLEQRANLSSAMNRVISVVPAFLNSSVSAHRIRELVQLPKEVHLAESSVLDEHSEDGLSVCVKDASYAYVEGKTVLNNVSFEAHPGEIIGLIGESGGGKTTAVRLILGLIVPSTGSVTLSDQYGESTVSNADTRKFISYVPQGNTMIAGTIAENLRTVNVDATDEELIDVLKMACAWEFVERMHDGIYSKVGERGKGLSEGQAQRIAIARALLRNSPILLFDEATSALDTATERRLLRNIMLNQSNKTIIVTSHRPSVLDLCERVYLVENGEIRQIDTEEAEKRVMDY